MNAGKGSSVGTVWFVGAGPGDPDLITVKGRRLLEQAGAILFAGSLVDQTATHHAPSGCEIRDSKDMTLEQMSVWLLDACARHLTVVRLQTGDPGLYGALVEMTRPLDAAGIDWKVVPGVSSAMASAAAAGETLTLPEVTQTVILTRVAGRTPMPAGEDLEALAAHRTTLCIFLSITLLHEVQRALRAAGWPEEAPIVVVQKASWPGMEKIVRGTLANIKRRCQEEKIASQAMIIASPALGARHWPDIARSKLYDPGFGHRFRKASATAATAAPADADTTATDTDLPTGEPT
ncbi:precorrin-4 C(11)-methyltransferase [Thauera sp.]|jgi:precorrin-4/cobalt-precorrin-4 C11-methyltransferase|uniref:precorrin-4 C(11)-methyltransferase n=1 Tax=Thauera sp. TaxID=1905334 RepID=UPI001B649F89|nr:precorrin-4 C(11)-methyltransferase [Thauera sp.]MBP9034200.1 precorrin-4 C(11)-methyltransferase [Pseudomonadales bacterium]MDX9885484.1 precorrin-4 C(11)-methyltransferase [Thauera sp.]